MDANTIGHHVHTAIENAGSKYFIIEGDFTLYDASQRQVCHELEMDIV